MSIRIFPARDNNSQHRKQIVLLHGFVSSAKYWRRLVPKLRANGYNVITIDLLGFGRARNISTNGYGWDEQLAHIDKSLDEAGVKEPVLLVGHSMGSLIAAEYAAKQPHRVRNLVMLHTPLYLEPEQGVETLHQTGSFYRFLLTSHFSYVGWGTLKFLRFGMDNHSAKAREESLKNIILGGRTVDIIEKTSTPSLLVIGTKDRAIYQDNVKKINIPKSMRVRLVHTGHHSAITHPGLMLKLVQEIDN